MGGGATAMLRQHAARMPYRPRRTPLVDRICCLECGKVCRSERGFADHCKRKHPTQGHAMTTYTEEEIEKLLAGPAEGALRIWWIPQVPGKAFHVGVSSVEEADSLLSVLAAYDAFQLEENIKSDYSNAGGLEVFEDDEWCDWHDPETGADSPEEYLRIKAVEAAYGASQ